MKIFTVLSGAAGLVFISGIISRFLFPVIPGSIISIILLAVLFFTGLLKPDSMAPVSSFFLENLSFFLVPAFAGCADLARYTGDDIYKILLLIFISTVIVMSVTALCSELLINVFYRKKKD